MQDRFANTVLLRAEKCRESIPLLRLVIGGVAARSKVSVDQLDDLQLAVETLIVEERSYEGQLVLEVQAKEGSFWLRLDGLCNQEVRTLLQSAPDEQPRGPRFIDVRMLLDALVDDYWVDEVDCDNFAVRLEKSTS